MKIKYIIIIFLVGLSFLPACTSFVLEQDDSYYLAKNLDWEIDRGYLFYNLAGIEKTSVSDPELKWVSTYKSITNNQFGKEFPLGGMNEAGLVVEEMSLIGQVYKHDESKRSLNEFQWVQYQLDMSRSVEDVIKSLETITIEHAIMNLHYLIADRSGDRAVIECLENGIVIHHGDELPYPVLSNNPYEKAMRYLGFFEGYGGEMEVLHRSGSQERFVSCVHLLNKKDALAPPASYALDLLDTVKQKDTRWQFIYDMTGKKIRYKTHDLARESKITFKQLKHIKHNQFAITLFGGEHKRVKVNAEMNKEQLKFVQDKLEEYFPGKAHNYDLMIKEGESSLSQRSKNQNPIAK